VKDYFRDAGWDTAPGETRQYFLFHRRRYEYLLSILDRLLGRLAESRRGEPIHVLDIGLSPLTRAIRANWPETALDTLGFADPRYGPDGGKHYEWDLNEAQRRDRWPALGPWDIIVFAEVLEHLHTAPGLVLGCVASWLRPGGYLLLQTQNAVSLAKRLMLLFGRHPYEMIREDPVNPGHFREYTAGELRALAAKAGLETREITVQNYFLASGWRTRMLKLASNCLPPAFREGITMVLQKPV
jgi:SAM-dependent methyltransferase